MPGADVDVRHKVRTTHRAVASELLHHMRIAKAAYSGFAGWSAAVKELGYGSPALLDRGATQAGVAWRDGAAVVAARGSEEFRDWLADLASVVPVRWRPHLPTGRVGWGFRIQVARVLEDLRCRTAGASRIIVTGHSLGGALAVMLGLALGAERVYAFEPPRAFTCRAAGWYNAHGPPTTLIVNTTRGERDLVTRVPPRRWGRRHVGRLVVLDGHRMFCGDDALCAWRGHQAENPVDSVAAWRVLTRLVFSVRSHSGRAILRNLELVTGA